MLFRSGGGEEKDSGSIQELYKIIQNQQKTIDDLLNRISILENPK